MNFSGFVDRVQLVLQDGLPPWESIVDEGRNIAKSIHIGRTAFMEKMGVSSEAEYKTQCIRNGTITYHAHIGMNTWRDTAEALSRLHQEAEASGFIVDRAGICLDRRMGLPEKYRKRVPAETGPMLETAEDWLQVGQCAPIQPHMGDFMIGFPSSTANTVNALKAGVTTIGNLSQFFAHEVPFWKDQQTTVIETTRAIAILGALQKEGVVLHSYLEDGFGAVFNDCATVAGWALLERYIVEHLLGCKLAHCIGGLTTDPIKRAGWIFALDEIHEKNCMGSMIYGDTISFTQDFTDNQGLIGEYLLWDIMAQIERPTGHAVLPLPVTEALRVPSVEEIYEIQKFGRRIEETARRLHPHVDFSPSYVFAETVVSGGRAIFRKALEGFEEAGADIQNPVQLLYLLKKIGPATFEKMFAANTHRDGDGDRKSMVPTDVYIMSQRCIDENRDLFLQTKMKKSFDGRRLLIASTDVHQNAIRILDDLLSLSGAHVINLGPEKDPDEIINQAEEFKVDAILISTHNGNALEYAQNLKKKLIKNKIRTPVVIGGRLNQKVEHQALPVDVSQDLKALGFLPCARLDQPFHRLIEFGDHNGGIMKNKTNDDSTSNQK
jgi:methylmalonyl-CoA mutase cobalamin-binding subunit